MNTAKAVRLEKERWPHRFCPDPRCLWRVMHHLGADTPCPKHQMKEAATSAQTEMTAVTADRQNEPAEQSQEN